MKTFLKHMVAGTAVALMAGCSSSSLPPSELKGAIVDDSGQYEYRVGIGDQLSIFVWGNPDISGDYSIRPDGKISMALTESLIAAGKTTAQLETALTKALSSYIKSPKVTVMISSASGNMIERVKLVGDAVKPASMAYRHGMTLLDLMIAVGGLSPYADGNDAELHRIRDGKVIVYELRIQDLLDDADLSANVDLMPGDVIRIPETWF
jgi:polysaccharide export outer membrane protein